MRQKAFRRFYGYRGGTGLVESHGKAQACFKGIVGVVDIVTVIAIGFFKTWTASDLPSGEKTTE